MNLLESYWRRLTAMRPEQALLVLQSTLAALAITPFGVWRLARGEWVQGGFDLVLVSLLLALAYLSIRGQWMRSIAFAMAGLYVLSSLFVSHQFGPLGHFWFFPAIVASFFVVRAREALALAGLGLLTHVYLVGPEGWGAGFTTFVATSLLVSVFIYAFATRLRQDNRRLYLDSTVDSLTGAGNRRLLDDVLAELPAGAGDQKEYSLLMLDIDHFKAVNDQYGHAIGDHCLHRLARLLVTDLGPSQRLFRYGGEEFVVLVEGGTAMAQGLAEHLRLDVERTQLIREAMITVSIGIATRLPDEGVHAWMRRADGALYDAKQHGRNRCCLAPVLRAV